MALDLILLSRNLDGKDGSWCYRLRVHFFFFLFNEDAGIILERQYRKLRLVKPQDGTSTLMVHPNDRNSLVCNIFFELFAFVVVHRDSHKILRIDRIFNETHLNKIYAFTFPSPNVSNKESLSFPIVLQTPIDVTIPCNTNSSNSSNLAVGNAVFAPDCRVELEVPTPNTSKSSTTAIGSIEIKSFDFLS